MPIYYRRVEDNMRKRIAKLYVLVLVLLIVLTKIFGIQIPMIAIDATVIVFLIFLNKDDLLYTMVFLLPLASCFQIGAHIWLIYLFMIAVKRKRFSARFISIVSIMLGLELFAHMYYDVSTLSGVVNYLANIALFVYIIVEFKNDGLSLIKVQKIYCASSFLLLLLFFLSVPISGGVDALNALFSGQERLGWMAGGNFESLPIKLNANTLAYYCIVEVALVLTMMRDGQLKKMQKIFFLCSALFSVMLGIMTGSRTFIVILLVMVVLFWFGGLKTKKQIVVSSILLITFCVIGVVIINSNVPIIDSALARFGKSDVISLNGRTDILSDYTEAFLSDGSLLVLGSGVTNYRDVFGFDLSIHNGTMQALVCYGIFGFIVFMFLILGPIMRAIRDKQPFYRFIPLIVSFAFIQTIQLLNPHILLFPLAMAYVPIFQRNSYVNKHLMLESVII